MDDEGAIPAGAGIGFGLGQLDLTETDNYAFLLNVSRLVDATSFTLAPGHELRRASADEIAAIKQTLHSEIPHLEVVSPWELQKGPDGCYLPSREAADWKYFVIGFRGTNATLCDIEQVLLLMPFDLRIAFTVIQWPGPAHTRAVVTHPGRLFQQVEVARIGEDTFLDVTCFHVEEIIKLLTQWRQHDSPLVDVQRITKGLVDMESLPPWSPLLFLETHPESPLPTGRIFQSA